MPWSDSVPQFSSAATILALALLTYAAIGEPLLGRWFYARLRRRRDSDPRALTRFYRAVVGIEWLWAAGVVAVLLLSPGLAASDLGLRPPDHWIPILGGLVGAGAVFAAFTLVDRRARRRSARTAAERADHDEWYGPGTGGPGYGAEDRFGQGGPRDPYGRGGPTGPHGHYEPYGPAGSAPAAPPAPEAEPRAARVPGAEVLAVMGPRTRAERRWAVAVAVTAGICEELLYRGLFVLLGVSFGLPVWAAAALSCVLFALAHVYQGWWGLVGPGVLGVLFVVLYLVTGSLVVPILAHLAIDLRALLLGPGGGRAAAGRRGAPGRRAAPGRRGGGRRGRRERGHAPRPASS